MENTLKTYCQEMDGGAQRQYIDARSVFTALEEAKKSAAEVRGGMLWKTQNGKDYLIRTTTHRGQKSLGPRSEQNEVVYREFTARKRRVERRVSELRNELERHRKLNKVFHVGRAPEIVVAILNKLAASGLVDYFTVIGTHSLYAYEAVAGIRITADTAMETRDIDLLLDTRKRLSFMAQMKELDLSFLGLLREVDPTFELRDDQLCTAVNNQGFEVDVIRREALDGDPHPLRLTDHEDEFYAVQAKRAGVLLDGEKFTAVIVSSTGRMARMNTISPVVFADFKLWMGRQENREPLKRQRDIFQAELVQAMVEEYYPNLQKKR
jgi:hypothetical protein